MATFWLQNLISYSLQIAAIAAAGGLLLHLLRIRIPKVRLFCWQALILISLLLPAIEPWRSTSTEGDVRVSTSQAIPTAHSQKSRTAPISLGTLALILFGAGVTIRFAMLGLGLSRLRGYRRNSRFAPGAFENLQRRIGVFADMQVSAEVSGPVTFGLLRPVILLPEDCLRNESIACHELVHVRRRDWLFTVVEECVLSIFWFHPAMWWLVSQIQLAREETVDREVVAILNSREQYLESLLALAAARAGFDLAPASPFLRKRHLRKRVASLLKEVSMSKLRLNSSLAAFVVALALIGWLSVRSFPLQAAPQDKIDAPGVTVHQAAIAVLHRAPVVYPKDALAKGIQGAVNVEVSLNESGEVSDARVLSGPEELRNATLQSALQWHFANDAHVAMKTQITVDFHMPEGVNVGIARTATPGLPGDDGAAVERINVNVPESLREKVQSNLSLHVGDHVTQSSLAELSAAMAAVDEHLQVTVQRLGESKGTSITIALANAAPAASPAGPGKIRVGGNVQAANLIQKVAPVYPPEAKAARIQGVVRFMATIGKDGSIEDLQLVTGHPLLVESAREAVSQWRYKTTLLNGNPVEVVTQIDVNYTLSQ